MSVKQTIRSFWSICLCCVVFLHLLTSPAYASSNSSLDSFTDGFWRAIGVVIGGSAGTVGVCYVVDVAIAPIAPPVSAYLTPMCPAIGSFVGGRTAIEIGSKVLAPAF